MIFRLGGREHEPPKNRGLFSSVRRSLCPTPPNTLPNCESPDKDTSRKSIVGVHQTGATSRIGPVRLEYPLRNIEPYRASLTHGRLPWWLPNTTTLAQRCRRGASTPSRWPLAPPYRRHHHHRRRAASCSVNMPTIRRCSLI